MSRSTKKKDARGTSGMGRNELSSSSTQQTSLVGSSVLGGKYYALWPEFSDNDINSEKWDGGREKLKSKTLQFFEDPEVKLEMPASLNVAKWKRPQEYLTSKNLVVVEPDPLIDIINPNRHLLHSEVMRNIISQITCLLQLTKSTASQLNSLNDYDDSWKPWEHIYSLCKAGKGHTPLYNPYGKYIIKLYWMGCWRKIPVDDLLPFDANEQLLLPASSKDYELWPMLLTKALIKIAALHYDTSKTTNAVGDYFVLPCLTGWIPESFPLKRSHKANLWQYLKTMLPEWKYEVPGTVPIPEDKSTESITEKKLKAPSEKLAPVVAPPVVKKQETSPGKREHGKGDKATTKDAKSSGKESTKKKEEKEKIKQSMEETNPPRSLIPEIIIFACFNPWEQSKTSLMSLQDTSKTVEELSKAKLPNHVPHPVLITKTRSCPLIQPPPVPETPRWKLIRPRKETSSQDGKEPPKPDQWLKVSSPFVACWPASFCPIPNRPLRPSVNDNESMNEGGTNSGFSSGSSTIKRGITNATTPKASKTINPLTTVVSTRHVSVRESGKDRRKVRDEKDQKIELKDPSSHALGMNIDNKESDGISIKSEDIDAENSVWVHFYDFCDYFHKVMVYHKPATYQYNAAATEIKQAISNLIASNTGHMSAKRGSVLNHSTGASVMNFTKTAPIATNEALPSEERTPRYLFVDNLKGTELIISFSILPRWPGLDERKNFDKDAVPDTAEVLSLKQQTSPLQVGLLVAEPFTWKSFMVGPPVLRIQTTGTYASCLTMPPGRHVLRFTVTSPLGYHIHIVSTNLFVYGDEDKVMAPLQEESCGFVFAAKKIMACVDKGMESIGDKPAWKKAMVDLRDATLPTAAESKEELETHRQAWRNAFYSTMFSAMGDTKSPSLKFALKTFMLDCSPAKPSDAFTTGSTKLYDGDELEKSPGPEHSEAEIKAVRLIQRNWRGSYVRKLTRGHNSRDSREHASVFSVLKSVRTSLQSNLMSHSSLLLRTLLKEDPNLMKKFPFTNDEWNKINYVDHQGSFSEQAANSWFLIFREVFQVEEDTFCVPKIYVPFPTCLLRVVDNDTNQEVKRVFQKVAPHVYKKNELGYTFVAEGWRLDQPLPSGKWKMRLIGSTTPLPVPVKDDLTNSFLVKDMKGYYIPNKSNVIMRCQLRCCKDHIGSLQFESSKPDVFIKLKIFDNEKEIVCIEGRGCCVVPAFYFHRTEQKRTFSVMSSGASSPGGKPSSGKRSVGSKRAISSKSSDIASTANFEKIINELPLNESHFYIIQATVEKKSWPLAEYQLEFLKKLKTSEREDIKVFSAPSSPVPPVQKEKKSPERQDFKFTALVKAVSDRAKKEKTVKVSKDKGKREKEEDIGGGARRFSQLVGLFEKARPHWILRFISDIDKGEDIQIKRDSKRQDEINAMKQAWESAQPGRSVKAKQSRLTYLSDHTLISHDKENKPDKAKTPDRLAIPTVPIETSPTPSPQPVIRVLKPFDMKPYLRPPGDVVPKYIDAENLAYIVREEDKKKMEEHEVKRLRALSFREHNRNHRRILKEQQLETCRDMQCALDKSRAILLKPRERYRQQLLEEKRIEDEARMEAAAAADAAKEAEKSPKSKGRKSKSPKGKSPTGKSPKSPRKKK